MSVHPFCNYCGGNHSAEYECRRPHPQTPVPPPAAGGVDAVAVKPLEWIDDGFGIFVADTGFFRYHVAKRGDGWEFWHILRFGALKRYATEGAAKAAAQADYEERVRSALALSPLREAITELGNAMLSRTTVPNELNDEMLRHLQRGEQDGYRAVWPDVLAAAKAKP